MGAAQALLSGFAAFRNSLIALVADSLPGRLPRERLGALAGGGATCGLVALLVFYFSWQHESSWRFALTDFTETPLRHSMVASVPQTRELAAHINDSTTPDDLVIADQVFWPLLHCRVANVPQIVAYRGIVAPSDFYRYRFPKGRFAYSPDLADARFHVEDLRLRARLIDPPDSAEGAVLLECRETWRLRLELGQYPYEYRLWENPALEN
jgi:hypothetical protein